MGISSLSQANAGEATGLVLVSTSSFSAVSSHSMDSVFSSEWDNYRVIITVAGSAAAELRFRVRASSTDLTTTYWFVRNDAAASSNVAYINAAYISGANAYADLDWTIRMPFAAQRTRINGSGFRDDGYLAYIQAYVGNTTSYDGFTVYPQSGTITGTASVYGYRRAV